MFSLFKHIPVYIKISRNKIEVTNLHTGETLYRTASPAFSTDRLVMAHFNYAESLIRSTLKEMNFSKSLFPPVLKMLIQQVEPVEEGLTEIEKRAYRDLAEQAGAVKAYLVEHFRPLSDHDALEEFKKKPSFL